jgi:hypothetical protein
MLRQVTFPFSSLLAMPRAVSIEIRVLAISAHGKLREQCHYDGSVAKRARQASVADVGMFLFARIDHAANALDPVWTLVQRSF